MLSSALVEKRERIYDKKSLDTVSIPANSLSSRSSQTVNMDGLPLSSLCKKKIIITNYKNFSPGSAKHHQIPVGIGLIGTGLRTVKKLIY